MSSEEPKVITSCDLFGQWLELGREVLGRYFPASAYATLVIPQGEGVPDCVLPVTPPRTPSPPPPLQPS